MAMRVICPYCRKESKGPDFLKKLRMDLGDLMESFFFREPMVPIQKKRRWIIKCSECGREFSYNDTIIMGVFNSQKRPIRPADEIYNAKEKHMGIDRPDDDEVS